MSEKIKIRMIESWTTIVVKECLEIDPLDFPELNGMTREEMMRHIEANLHNMRSQINGVDLSLYDMCCLEDVVSERIKNETTDIEWE